MNTTARRPLVLVAEDDDDHVLLTRMAFQRANVAVDLEVVRDGAECMDYLLRRNGKEAVRRPDLLLLDLHMPRLSGIEVMQQILEHEDLRALPVVALSTSEAPADVGRMYGLRVNSYISKPVDFDQYTQLIATLAGYWFGNVVLLPQWG